MVKPSLRDITTSGTSLRVPKAGQAFGQSWFGLVRTLIRPLPLGARECRLARAGF